MTQDATAALLVYIGTYTQTLPHVEGKATGIAVYRLDPASGGLTLVQEVAGLENPSYLAVDPRGRSLYATEEVTPGRVRALAIAPDTGALTVLNQQPSAGAGPAHLSVDREARWVLVANYDSGSIAVLPIQPDGSLGAATATVQHTGHSVN